MAPCLPCSVNKKSPRPYGLGLQDSRGGDEGIRTPDPLTASQVLSQLSYTPVGFMVGDEGFEPPTLCV